MRVHRAGVFGIRHRGHLNILTQAAELGDLIVRIMTVPATHALLARHFAVTAVDRVYPDDPESAFGTRQSCFEARRRA